MAQTAYYKWTIGNAGAKITASEINTIINNMYNTVLPNKKFSSLTKPSLVTQGGQIYASSLKSIYTNLPSEIKNKLPANFNTNFFGTSGLILQNKPIKSTDVYNFLNQIDAAIYNYNPSFYVSLVFTNFNGSTYTEYPSGQENAPFYVYTDIRGSDPDEDDGMLSAAYDNTPDGSGQTFIKSAYAYGYIRLKGVYVSSYIGQAPDSQTSNSTSTTWRWNNITEDLTLYITR